MRGNHSRKSKDSQYNGQKLKEKKTNNTVNGKKAKTGWLVIRTICLS